MISEKCFGPPHFLIKCGIMSPTNPIIPDEATQAPVISDAVMKMILIVLAESTPR